MASPGNLYTETMNVYSASYAVDDSGGSVRSTVLKASSQPCRIQTSSASGSLINSGEGMEVIYRIFTDYANCINGDELRVGSSTYRVTGTPIKRRAIGSMDAFYVIDALEVVN